jgi:hypothetical protein
MAEKSSKLDPMFAEYMANKTTDRHYHVAVIDRLRRRYESGEISEAQVIASLKTENNGYVIGRALGGVFGSIFGLKKKEG